MQSSFRIEVETPEGADYEVIKFNGDFDKAGYLEVKDALEKAVKAFKGKTLVFDFASLKFISSEGIGHVMEIHGHLAKAKKALVVVAPKANVKDVMKAIGMDEIVKTYASLNEFLNAK